MAFLFTFSLSLFLFITLSSALTTTTIITTNPLPLLRPMESKFPMLDTDLLPDPVACNNEHKETNRKKEQVRVLRHHLHNVRVLQRNHDELRFNFLFVFFRTLISKLMFLFNFCDLLMKLGVDSDLEPFLESTV